MEHLALRRSAFIPGQTTGLSSVADRTRQWLANNGSQIDASFFAGLRYYMISNIQ
jgi:hypothetical protein